MKKHNANKYKIFKNEVLRVCNKTCENKHCDAEADQVHHFFKQSTFPEYKYDIDNGVGICGSCHSEIERRIRQNEDWMELIPVERYNYMLGKIINDREDEIYDN